MLYSFVCACVLTFVTSFFFAALVLFKNPKVKINFLWSLMGFSVALWALGLGLMSSAPNKTLANFYLIYIHYLGALMIPAFFFHFVLALLKLEYTHRWPLIGSYLITFLLQIANFTGTLAYVASTSPFYFYTRAGPFYLIFTLFFFLVVIYTNFLLFKYYRSYSGLIKNQIGYLFLSMIIGFAGGSTAFFPVFNIPIFPFGMYFMFLHIPLMSYAIIKHQLMNIDVFLQKGLIILFLLAFTLIPTFLISFVYLSWTAPIVFKSLTLAAMILALGLLLPQLKIRGEIKIKNILFSHRFDYRKSLKKLQHAFISKLELNPLLETIVTTIAKALDLREIAIFIKQQDGAFLMPCFLGDQCQARKTLVISRDSPLIDYLNNTPALPQSEKIKRFLANKHFDKEWDFFNSIHLKLLLPIRTSAGIIALLALGDMHTEFDFTAEDQELFLSLSAEIAIAIENAMAFQQIQDLNTNLDIKVKERSNQLIQAQKLASIGQLVAGIAHHINNKINPPIQSVSIIKDRLDKLLVDPKIRQTEEFQDVDTCLEIMKRNLDFVKTIVDDLLISSRQTPLEFDFKKLDLNSILATTVRIIGTDCLERVTIHEDYCKNLPLILGDIPRLEDVFMNLLRNSLDAIPQKGNIWVKTWQENNSAFASIRDDGYGINEDKLSKIFDFFYTTKDVGKGTGLGLSVSYATIKEHKGDIQVKSKINYGTEFIVQIPLAEKEKGNGL